MRCCRPICNVVLLSDMWIPCIVGLSPVVDGASDELTSTLKLFGQVDSIREVQVDCLRADLIKRHSRLDLAQFDFGGNIDQKCVGVGAKSVPEDLRRQTNHLTVHRVGSIGAQSIPNTDHK